MKVLKDLENLYKRMDTTSKTRFAASRRLSLHSKLSTAKIGLNWTPMSE
ncbi:hypothetical protein [Aliarcobacter butzleri]|nr:hypothetical protein [Aliarcobacter butzleri]MCG3677614.1 hypothetical protein [Aliarcobacter butzleri]